MKVALEKSFDIQAPVADCWQLLSDIPRLATCMPGASITQVIDASHFEGCVMVSIGPMRLQFTGELEQVAMDTSNRTLVLMAKGVDKKGSSAMMQLTASLVDKQNQESALRGHAEITVNGPLVQLGSRMIGPVSDVILSQFADQFRQKVSLSPEAADMSKDAEPPKPALNATQLLWLTAKRVLSGTLAKENSSSSGVKKESRISSIWRSLYRKS